MKKIPTLLLFSLLACFGLLQSCKSKNPEANKATNCATATLYTPRYAKRFELLQQGESKILNVKNPWQGAQAIEYSYRITAKPTSNIRDIKFPVEKVVCLSSTHVAFVGALDRTDAIAGVSGPGYITNEKVQARIARKQIYDVGYESSISYELIASLKPDVVFAYGVEGEMLSIEKKLNELGVRMVYIGEYMETSPLGKAEWLIAVAAFFGDEAKASSIFDVAANEYEQLKAEVASLSSRPKVMLNAPYKGVWYVPGGGSYMACLLNDAGSSFLYGNNSKVESTPVSLESAYLKSMEADYWLNPNAACSLNELKLTDERLADAPAFKNGRVYNNNARITKLGGSDFWESGVVNPQVILKDLVRIFHPQLLPEHELYYFRHLK